MLGGAAGALVALVGLAGPATAGPRSSAPPPSAALAMGGTGSGGNPLPVASAGPRSLSEPVAASDQAGTVVVATTNVVSGPPAVTAWDRPPDPAASWQRQGAILPSGFTSAYDPSLTTLPGGGFAAAAVAATAGPNGCLPHGSVYLTTTPRTSLSFGRPVLVNSHLGGGGFDDRPFVAAGPSGTLWVAWSHGQAGDDCQIVGQSDQVQVTASTDGGRSFASPITLPKLTAGPAFGVQVAPLGGGRAAVSWSELDGQDVTVALATVTAGGSYSPPHAVATEPALPSVLPGATFYSFSLPTLVALGGGRDLAMAWPWWKDGAGAVELALSTNLGRTWSTTTVDPAPGTDLLLPALSPAGPGRLRALFAVHSRSGDVVSYATLEAEVGPRGEIRAGPATTVLNGSPGPGFKELGEFLFLTRSPGRVTGALIDGGASGATLEVLAWRVPGDSTTQVPAPASGASASAGAGSRAHSAGRAPAQAAGPSPAVTALKTLLAVLVVLAAAVVGLRARVLRRRRVRRQARQRARRAATLSRVAAHGAGSRPATVHRNGTGRHPVATARAQAPPAPRSRPTRSRPAKR